MRRLLQNEQHSDNDYDRPNLPWVCGNAEGGCPCPLGPTAGGACPEVAECEPQKVGDEWQCTRSPARGGPCEEDPLGGGPAPDGTCCKVHRCRPIRSLRQRRGRMAVGMALFAVGALCVAIGSSWRTEALAPGELSQPHARLIAGSANRCSACHPGGVEAALGLPQDPAHQAANATTQSALCMECHQEQFDRAHATDPHGISPAVLAVDQHSASHPADIACATCHQEHHGADHDLTYISNGRCQACHQQQYDSFASDHPDFGHWPYRRRTRINFDHNAHASKHFAAKGQEFSCKACHIDGPHGETKLTVGFEQSCAKCHTEDIALSASTGIRVLALPTLDDQAIAAAGGKLGPWPEGAVGDFDGELPAITKLLLAADPKAAAALERLRNDFSFFDLDPDSQSDTRDAALLAGELRKLVAGLAEQGHQEILSRVAKLAARPIHEQKDLAGAAPVALFSEASGRWFRAGSTPSGEAAIDLAARQPAGGWLIDNAAYSLRLHSDRPCRSAAACLDRACRIAGRPACQPPRRGAGRTCRR